MRLAILEQRDTKARKHGATSKFEAISPARRAHVALGLARSEAYRSHWDFSNFLSLPKPHMLRDFNLRLRLEMAPAVPALKRNRTPLTAETAPREFHGPICMQHRALRTTVADAAKERSQTRWPTRPCAGCSSSTAACPGAPGPFSPSTAARTCNPETRSFLAVPCRFVSSPR